MGPGKRDFWRLAGAFRLLGVSASQEAKSREAARRLGAQARMKRRYSKRLHRQLWPFALTDRDSPSLMTPIRSTRRLHFGDAARCYAFAVRPHIFAIWEFAYNQIDMRRSKIFRNAVSPPDADEYE